VGVTRGEEFGRGAPKAMELLVFIG